MAVKFGDDSLTMETLINFDGPPQVMTLEKLGD
jgi:hypothetical protein